MLVGSWPSGNQRTPGAEHSPSQPATDRKKAMRPLPETSCITWASDTFSASMSRPAWSEATRTAVSAIVSRSASWPEGGSYAPSP
jgi:hypothetical protein